MISICAGPECSRQSVAKGLCNAHYQQHNKGQKLRPVKRYKKTGTIAYCPIPGCEREQHSRGLCSRHHSICNRFKINTEEYVRHYLKGCHNSTCSETTKLEVDHDHACCDFNGSCGSCIRGLLCTGCNMLAMAVDRERKTEQDIQGIKSYLAQGRLSVKPLTKISRKQS